MIEEKTSRTYFVTWGNSAPPSPIRDEAVPFAIEDGFQCVHRWNGLEYFSIHLCAECYAAQEEEGKR